jgi:hypothetical protein
LPGLLEQDPRLGSQILIDMNEKQFLKEISEMHPEPLETIGAWGQNVLEWWNGNKKLTIHFDINDDSRVSYVKVWGPDMDSEMETGSLEYEGFKELWKWLQDET